MITDYLARSLAVLSLVLGVVALGGSSVAAQGPTPGPTPAETPVAVSTPTFSAEPDWPYLPLGVTLRVEGLTECAGLQVLLALYDAPDGPAQMGDSTYAHAYQHLDATGSGAVTVYPPSGGFSARLGVSGSCVPRGIVSSAELFSIPELQESPSAMIPPLGPGETTIVVPVGALDRPVEAGKPSTPATFNQATDVFAGGQRCGTWSFIDPAQRDMHGNSIFVLGAPGQHPNCSKAGLDVCFERFTNPGDQAGRGKLYQVLTLTPGQVMPLPNLNPDPPHYTPCAGPRVPGPPDTGQGLLQPSLENWTTTAALGVAAMLAATVFAIVRRQRT